MNPSRVRFPGLLLAALALALAARCQSTRSCKAGTLLVTVTLDGATSGADQLEVDVKVANGSPKTTTLVHTPGQPVGSIEIDFPNGGGYPAGRQVDVTVVASNAGTTLGMATLGVTALPDGCGTLAITLGGSVGDGGAGAGGQVDGDAASQAGAGGGGASGDAGGLAGVGGFAGGGMAGAGGGAGCTCSSGQQQCDGAAAIKKCTNGCTWTSTNCATDCQQGGFVNKSTGCANDPKSGKDVCWCPSSSKDDIMIWPFRDECDDGIGPTVELYDNTASQQPIAPPGAFVLQSFGQTVSVAIECVTGDQVCWGGWQGTKYWGGCGMGCKQTCPACCHLCGSKLSFMVTPISCAPTQ